MANNIWQLQDAKSRLSELVERTLKDGVQIVTRHGKNTVVVLPFDEYQRMTRAAGRLSEFLLASPLAGSNLSIERDRDLPRDIHIEP
jgi:antitoxin Phd